MALELSFNVLKIYNNFCKSAAKKFPKNFSSIPYISNLEKEGYVLKEVYNLTHDRYEPDELQKFLRESLLPWGIKEEGEDFWIQDEVLFVFENKEQRYELKTNLIVNTTKLELSDYKPKERLKLIPELPEKGET